MAEEFSFSVRFRADDAEHLETIEALKEHLDMEEADEARALLRANAMAKTSAELTQLIPAECDVDFNCDWVDCYLNYCDDGIQDVALTLNNTDSNGKVEVEGVDHEAHNFCCVLVVLLTAAGAKIIEANGGSAMWSIRWQENMHRKLECQFESWL